MLTSLGYAGDKRLIPALKILKKKRQGDGTWLLDMVHPDLRHGVAENEFGVDRSIKPFVLEEAGKPSKWITLTALKVLSRIGES